MENTFGGLVEEIQNLPLEDKQELLVLLEKSIAEERRDEIFNNFLNTKKEETDGKLVFSSDIKQLKKML